MKYIQINRANMAAFEWISNADELSLIEKGVNSFGIGAVEEEQNRAVGILIFSVLKDNTIVHRWLYVANEFRNRGIAKELMHRFYSLVSDLKISKVSVAFPNSERSPLILSFYQGFGYIFARTLIYEMHTTLRDIAKHDLFKNHKIPESIAALDSVGSLEIKRFIGAIPKQRSVRYRQLSTGTLDRKVSSVHIREHRICGALLIECTPSRKLLPVLFHLLEHNNAAMVSLMRRSFIKAAIEYGLDTEVVINCEQKGVGAYIDRLFPEKGPICAWRGEYVY